MLTNLLGIPPTPPPPNVPQLKDAGNGVPLSLRARMEQHRSDAVCAGCHKVMDPIGFALENFDAVGHWRAAEDGAPIDASGTLYNGAKINGAADLDKMLSSHPEVFVGVMTEKLLTYALGRGVQYTDMPAVRGIVTGAKGSRLPFLAGGRDCGEYAVRDEGQTVRQGDSIMNFIFKKHIERRAFLRGLGTAISLPLLDSMLPAQTPLARPTPPSGSACALFPMAPSWPTGRLSRSRPTSRCRELAYAA